MPYKPKGIRPMKGTGAIIINVLPSSTILTPPTFFKAKMDENFFFSYLVFFKEKNSSTLTLREFPGVEFSDGSSSPSNLTQEPVTTWKVTVSSRCAKWQAWRQGWDGWWGQRTRPSWVDGDRAGAGGREPREGSPLLCILGEPFPSELHFLHTLRGLTRPLPALSSWGLHLQLGTERIVTIIYFFI